MRQLWSEIRRRHVLRVAAYYVAGAWVLAQAGDLMLDAFGAGDYTRYLIAGLVLGLPVALALAWIFDVTPRGIERTLSLRAPVEEAAVPVAAADAPPNSVAVLPFANLSQDPANEYFSDGLSEEIRNQLARIGGLRVAARTSSFAFKGRHADVRDIGRQLNVATLLEGGVRRENDRVRIDVQLVSTADGFHLWSENFERQLGDVFRLQSEVSAAVIEAVSERHGLGVVALPASQPRAFEAYNAYLLGRHHFHQRTEASLQRAAGHFRRAIEVDPEYAVAYSGLADATVLSGARYYGNVPSDEALAIAEPAIERALQLEPSLAEAHASLGLVKLNRGDVEGAEQSLARAIELNPGYSTAHVWMALALLAQGRYREAAERNREAWRRDPLSPIVNSNVGFDALRFGDYAEAEARFRAAIELDPGFPVPCSGMSRLQAARGDLDGALAWVERGITIAPTRAFYYARRGLLRLQAGDLEGAGQSIDTARHYAPDNVLDAELLVAWRMVRGDRSTLEKIANGECGRAYLEPQRAAAYLALGHEPAATELYDRSPPDPRKEVEELMNDDWVWRLPHSINRAHLWIRAGEVERGRAALVEFLGLVDAVLTQGARNGDVRYWAGAAEVLLGNTERAIEHFEAAVSNGWRHAWWARLDWNLGEYRTDPRVRALLKLD